jgi:hypothetical protein
MGYGRGEGVELDRVRNARKLDRDFVRRLSERLSLPASKVFVQQFGARATR